ncbi:hypothetical protein CBS101457_002346 [Exobasidium rhododendri]|nr:hypothetical protein CBS101457_002346 [Exobasidium rhododendri]
MAVSTASSFRPGRKQMSTSSNAPFTDHNSSQTLIQPSYTLTPASTAMHQQWGSGAGAGGSSSYTSASLKNANDGGIGSSLIPASGMGPGGAALMLGAPLAANTIGNKPAVAGSSLYQACLTLRDRLWCVPGFGEAFLSQGGEEAVGGFSSALPSPNGLSSPANSRPRINASDPVTQLWQCFRLGAPLCWLFNNLKPRNELVINPDANRSNANECKKQVAKFIIALNHELAWDSDDIFTVSQLYLNDTNGFVKVIRTISKLLDVFENRGLLTEAPTSAGTEELEKPSDDRAWIVRELLDTERKYVQDLEVMQNYARALAQMDILPPDTIHNLFGNLNTLVDVQRRFLICVEENVRRPADDQHFGHVFQTMESDFAVYEPFCANYAQALDIINAEAHNIMRLRGQPAAEGCYLDPSYELPTFLIKPVQRICKYPLLLEQLLKKTAKDAPFYQELVDGLQVIRRITDKVNETRRLQENIQVVRDLESRVGEWKGHSIQTFGPLLLSDVFMVSKSDTEREYHVYLFEKIILCCKEVLPIQPKKNSKNNSLLKQKSQGLAAATSKKAKTPLQLKGRIFINNVTGANAVGKANAILGGGVATQYALQVHWQCDPGQEFFSLRCKNEEQLKQWQAAITKLIEDVTLKKQHIAAQNNQAGGISPGTFNMAGAGANGRRSTSGNQQMSMFPQTPLTESIPAYPFTRADSQMGHRYFDEDHVEGMRDGFESGMSSGRGTPVGGRYSHPAEQREKQLSYSTEVSKPRARTEDQDSHTMSQWKTGSPVIHPPMPRNGSTNSSSEVHLPLHHPSGQGQPHQLRKASSSKQLRQTSNQRPSMRKASGSGDIALSDYDSPGERVENQNLANLRSGLESTSLRGTSQESLLSQQQYSRSRSNSNPSAYAGVASSLPPPLPRPTHQMGVYTNGPYSSTDHHQQQQQHFQPHSQHQSPQQQHSTQQNTAKSSSQHRHERERRGSGSNEKRFSSSSVSTSDSNRSSHSRPGSTAASSPLTLSGGSSGGVTQLNNIYGHHPGQGTARSNTNHALPPQQPSQHQSNAVKLVIHHGDDKLVVVVLSSISLLDLTEKVSKKIRLVSGRRDALESLRIRYIDEDGDKILMHDDEDVQMAFEMSRNLGTDVNLVVQ